MHLAMSPRILQSPFCLLRELAIPMPLFSPEWIQRVLIDFPPDSVRIPSTVFGLSIKLHFCIRTIPIYVFLWEHVTGIGRALMMAMRDLDIDEMEFV